MDGVKSAKSCSFKSTTLSGEISQSVDLSEEEKSVADDLGLGMRESRQVSCCSSDISEFEKIRKIEGQIFKDGKKDIIPEYLKSDFPPQESQPARTYLQKQKRNGDRPPAEIFMLIANKIYVQHMIKE